MILAPLFRRASVLAVVLLPVACFDVSDAPPLGDGSTGPSPSTTDATTGETMAPDSTGPVSESTGPDDPSTSGVDPDSSSGTEESSSGSPPDAVCGDGVRDPETEACDDGNLEPGDLCDASCQVETMVFSFTGMTQTYDVPGWVDSLEVEAWGAQGGGAMCCDRPMPQEDGGQGGHVSGVLTTIGGVTLTINVGGQGVTEGPGGFNGGGDGGQYGAGGGGATDVRIGAAMLPNRLLVAAGGGGGNCGCPDTGSGGAGGGLSGQDGIGDAGLLPGGGGTQNAGGAAGEEATAGTLGQGGSSAVAGDLYHFGGGGGGYYGGGGAFGAGGGGGSSYLGVLSNGATMPGVREGDGELRITPVSR